MSAPAGPYFPTNALVAVAWLSQRVNGLAAGMVATKLPRDVTTWADLGFVQVTVIPGAPGVDIPVRHPVIQCDCYATTADAAGNVSTKPPVNKANRLAELIRVATEDGQLYGRPVTMPTGYLGARVLAAYVTSEPAEVADDPSGYARVTLDLALDWARL